MRRNINTFGQLLIALLLLCTLSETKAQLSEKALERHLEQKAQSVKQKSVVLSADTIFQAGVPYALLHKEKTGTMSVGYVISTIEGKKIMYVTTSLTEDVSEFRPLRQTKLSAYTNAMGSRRVAKIIVENKLLASGGLDVKNYKAFQHKHQTRPGVKSSMISVMGFVNYNASGRSAQAKRNRKADILVLNGAISQDDIQIGSYNYELLKENNQVHKVYQIRHLDGTVCAKLTIKAFESKTMNLTTQWNNRTIKLRQSKFHNKNLEEAVKYLVKHTHL